MAFILPTSKNIFQLAEESIRQTDKLIYVIKGSALSNTREIDFAVKSLESGDKLFSSLETIIQGISNIASMSNDLAKIKINSKGKNKGLSVLENNINQFLKMDFVNATGKSFEENSKDIININTFINNLSDIFTNMNTFSPLISDIAKFSKKIFTKKYFVNGKWIIEYLITQLKQTFNSILEINTSQINKAIEISTSYNQILLNIQQSADIAMKTARKILLLQKLKGWDVRIMQFMNSSYNMLNYVMFKFGKINIRLINRTINVLHKMNSVLMNISLLGVTLSGISLLSPILIAGTFIGLSTLKFIINSSVSFFTYTSKKVKDNKKDLISGMKGVALITLLLSGSVFLMVMTAKKVSEMNPLELLKGFAITYLLMGVTLFGAIAMFKLTSKMFKKGGAKDIAMTMLMIGGIGISIVLFSKTMLYSSNAFEELMPHIPTILLGLGSMVAITLAMKLIGHIAQSSMLQIATASLSMVLIGGSMLISSYLYQKTADIFGKTDWENFAIGNAIILGELTAFTLAGYALIASGGVGTIPITVGMILVMSGGLLSGAATIDKINKYKFNKNKIESTIDAMMSGYKIYANSVLEIAPKIALASLMTIPILSISKAITSIGGAMSDIANLKMATGYDKNGNATGYRLLNTNDFINAGNNIGMIISATISPMLRMLNGEIWDFQSNSWISANGDVANLFKPSSIISRSPIGRVIHISMKLGKLMSKLASGVSNIANLNMATAWDNEGNPISYRAIGENDFINAGNNVGRIVTTILSPLIKMASGQIYEDGIWKMSPFDMNTIFEAGGMFGLGRSPIGRVIHISMKLGNMMSSLAGGIQDISMLKIATGYDKNGKAIGYTQMKTSDFDNAGNNVGRIVTTIITKLTSLAATPQFQEVSKPGFFDLGEDNTSPLAVVLRTGKQVGVIINSLAKDIASYAELKFPLGSSIVDLNGKLDLAGENISKVFGVSLNSFVGITNEYPKSKLKKANKSMDSIKDLFNNAGKAMKPMIEIFNSKLYQEFDSEFSTKINTILQAPLIALSDKTLMNTIDNIDSEKLGDIGKATQKMTKAIRGLTPQESNAFVTSMGSMSSMLDSVNMMDLNKLNSLTKMTESLANFASEIQGDFNGLAEVLNEKLVIVLENLNTTLSGKPSTNTQTKIEPKTIKEVSKEKIIDSKSTKEQILYLEKITNHLKTLISSTKEIVDNTEDSNIILGDIKFARE